MGPLVVACCFCHLQCFSGQCSPNCTTAVSIPPNPNGPSNPDIHDSWSNYNQTVPGAFVDCVGSFTVRPVLYSLGSVIGARPAPVPQSAPISERIKLEPHGRHGQVCLHAGTCVHRTLAPALTFSPPMLAWTNVYHQRSTHWPLSGPCPRGLFLVFSLTFAPNGSMSSTE